MKKVTAFCLLLMLVLNLMMIGCSGNQAPTSSPATTEEESAPAQDGTVHQTTIKNFAFSEAEIVINVGGAITWANNDSPAHTVSSRDGLFDSENLAGSATYSHTFTEKGTFQYYCKYPP